MYGEFIFDLWIFCLKAKCLIDLTNLYSPHNSKKNDKIIFKIELRYSYICKMDKKMCPKIDGVLQFKLNEISKRNYSIAKIYEKNNEQNI